MLRKREERRCQVIPGMKGGAGEFRLLHIAEPSEMGDKAAVFAVGCLPPGASVGKHRHQESMEVCCFLGGSGMVREEKAEYAVSAGDVSICFEGGCHEVINTGSIEMVYLALVIKMDSKEEDGV
ncbi:MULTISPECIES: cupin domain-containing protein [unclassified Clostridium]|uniref:cupin domain-containing protein n=1 Tax=unclassified Clostridium TaxID=2614128 RepID=UPI001106823C|nr:MULTISPECIES: cupin domain-containing protein [unclassified Clostridium]